MKKSRVCALGLACFLGAVTAFSALAATSGGGALLRNLSDNYAHSGASLSGQNGAENLSAEEEKIAAEMQADLLAGTLELDPQNDPVLGTTENGITIRYHNTALTGTWDYDAFMKNYVGQTNSATYGKSTSTSLSGYFYVTLGGYNWVIIGRNSNLSWVNTTFTNTYAQSNEQISNFIKFASYSTYANALKSQIETTTDAGIALNSANSKGLVNTVSSISRNYSINFASYSSPVATTEIPSGCVLCLCEGYTEYLNYNSSSSYSYYPNSYMDSEMTSLYESIKSEANNQIQLTSLKTYGYNGSSYTTYSHSDYLFPLATNFDDYYHKNQNFFLETYLKENSKLNIGAKWWLRTGTYGDTNYVYYVWSDGMALYVDKVTKAFAARPAFVLKIT